MAGRTYVDCTLGGGGHALEILRASAPDGRVIGMDRDDAAIRAAGAVLARYRDRVTLLKENFRNLRGALTGLGVEKVDGVVMDLGVSSYQLESPERGFSFRLDAGLDMRMDRSAELSARDLVNDLGEKELADIFHRYGEERFSARVARAIVRARQTKPVETTGELAAIVIEAIPKKFHGRKIHPATKVFQALRIAVNDELESIRGGLSGAVESLSAGGRLVVISFHSLEDRLVKGAMRELSTGCICPPRIPMCVCGRSPAARLLTKKAVTPSPGELERNPRSRSARLRALEMLPAGAGPV
jgi:16S rRNA (cytosine1402-N4)-methyltransferase